MSKEKEQKRKPKYGMFSSVAWMYRLLWKNERSLAWLGIVTVPVSVAMAALTLYLPSIVLHYLETSDQFCTIALVITGLLLAQLLTTLANTVIEIRTDLAEHFTLMYLRYMRLEREHDRDWYHEYDPKVKELDERVENAIQNNHTNAVHFPLDFASMAASVIQFFLFGAVVSGLNPWIVLLLVVGCVINSCMSQWEIRRNYETQDQRNILGKKISYVAFRLSRDYEFGKDIRLYNFRDYLNLLAKKLMKEDMEARRDVTRRSIAVGLVSFLIVMVRDGVAYLFLISKAVSGEIDASQFVLYFSAITSLSTFLSDILGKWSKITDGAMGISDFREVLEVNDKNNRGEGIPLPDGAFSIEFRDVSYQYPKGEKKVLDHVSFRIKAGEKIALVGLNGAGKTTLTRLMCGLLLPDEGEILLDGHSLQEYNRDEMYTLFGVVPQDYHLMPVSIAQNIAVTVHDEEIDREKLERCIEMAGLKEKIETLPQGVDTMLNRQVNREGIDLSGGETQKLLMARLLYHSPKCMILDEPTAALDPIAEDRMYRRYSEITDQTTSIFISHRLASTRFCDRIFLLDGAAFAEEGTHDELMAAGKKYRELFEIQSKYYREDGSFAQEPEEGGSR
ncbi:MAG: ABC transporter ATP-binding protein [Lachnospiraceae bacterium]|nr:ABC transporter ATP-binding protein [Lachnospiraceae bacterium]